MPKGFTEHEKKIIVERLLEQGHKLFAAYGLKKTNIEELTKAAGISKGAFYLFYESKEALFMDVVEQTEQRFRHEVLSAINLPGTSPRSRLFAVLKKAFTLWKTTPLQQTFTSSEYAVLTRRVPAEKVQEHMDADRKFVTDFVARCQEAGIPIRAPVEQIDGLFHALFFTVLHEDDFGPGSLSGAVEILLELAAAFCLGEISVHNL